MTRYLRGVAEWRLSRVQALRGEVVAPPDKSITHRAILLAAGASSASTIKNPLLGHDCQATLRAVEQMGAQVFESDHLVRVVPASEWQTSPEPIDCGNSGTTMRLLMGMIASRPIRADLVGDRSLSKRPMKRVTEPLRQMGATISADQAPLVIDGGSLRGIDFVSSVASAQVKSCVLLAGLGASGETWVREPAPSRDHTEVMLRGLGVEVKSRHDGAIGVVGGSRWEGADFVVPGDPSSAAFFLVAGVLAPNSEILVKGAGLNPTRTGILDVLHQMEADVEVLDLRFQSGEAVGDIRVCSSTHLKPFEISGPLVPRLIDEIPVLAILATQAHGTSVIRDAQELRVKESDRIAKVVESLRSLGAQVEAKEDGMEITGPTPLSGGLIEAHLDHRIAMSFAVASLIAQGEVVITGVEAVETSYPGFLQQLKALEVV